MHSLLLRPAHVKVFVGEPIETRNLTPRDRAQLNETLHDRVAELADEMTVPVSVS
jgi:hypothetical protein